VVVPDKAFQPCLIFARDLCIIQVLQFREGSWPTLGLKSFLGTNIPACENS
jgi:hypothetical protein